MRNVWNDCPSYQDRQLSAGSAGAEDCFKGGEHMICLPGGYQKYDLPLNNEPVRVFIEVHIKDIPKVYDLLMIK